MHSLNTLVYNLLVCVNGKLHAGRAAGDQFLSKENRSKKKIKIKTIGNKKKCSHVGIGNK